MSKRQLPHQHGNVKIAEKMIDELMNSENFYTVANIFKQLGDSSRLKIYWLLCHCEECVINISSMVDMSSPAVSHHLRALKESGLVISRRVGKEVYYKAADIEENRYLDKAVEKIMEVSCPKTNAEEHASACKNEKSDVKDAEHIGIMENIHEYLVQNLDKRITIEDLSKKYHINTTTIKELFKSMYGTSVATHVKQHRIEKAAELLTTTSLSIAEISRTVGYENAGKFTAVFKGVYDVTPKEYRKKHT
ncbi:MAG: metalloregulator ArsR/SmtB family transcription factor [Ruminococcaceae bacterium]|nr:metalloregulator ArsR/SmtB family transcription factor [Oscillospiraceae bacterium]